MFGQTEALKQKETKGLAQVHPVDTASVVLCFLYWCILHLFEL